MCGVGYLMHMIASALVTSQVARSCRCGKTPLAIYLGQRGYKVANLPLVPEAPLPPQLFQIDPHKVVALEIDPGVLARIRATRVSRLGVQEDAAGSGEEDAFDYAGVKVRMRGRCHACWSLAPNSS